MPDLSLKSARKFWSDFVDPHIYRVIAFLESEEQWTLDGHVDIEKHLEQLGKELDEINNVDMSQLKAENYLIQIGCNLKSSRVLYILKTIDNIHPGAASQVLMRAEELSQQNDQPANTFLKRNITFERLRLLSRVFSKERFQLVLKALEYEE